MGVYALELNDADFIARDRSGERLRDSGHARIDADTWHFGAMAAAGARLHPHATVTTQWSEPDAATVGAMPFPAAEAVYRQMLSWRDALGADRGIWLASPASTRVQLGLLLGVAQAAGLEVCLLADRAAVAVSALPVDGTVYHLDVELERGLLSEVHVHAGRAARHRLIVLPEMGQRALLSAWCKGFSARMVAQTRFDPLHDAATEQALFDTLPQWLEQLRCAGSIPEAGVEAHGRRYTIEYRTTHAAADAAAAYRILAARLHGLRPARRPATILLSATAARLPGILDALAGLNDCPLYAAGSGQAAGAALGIREESQLQGRANALLLGVPHIPDAAWLPAREAAPADAATAATHVVFAGRAMPLSVEPLAVGTTAGVGRSLTVPAAVPGVSRRHCTLLLEGGQAFIVDHSRFGSFLNGERVPSRALLRVGDTLRLGNPGVELSFVRLE